MIPVDIRWLELDVGPARTRELGRLLSTAEREWAARLRFDRDRDRYVAGRGQLRLVLAERTGVPAEALTIAAATYGKPYLPDFGDVRFNVSNADGVGLLAITDGAEVGIDVEPVRQMDDLEAVARRVFCDVELRELLALDDPARPSAFARCWTRKEAYVKALGDGLQMPLDRFAVTLLEDAPVRLRWTAVAGEAERWELRDLSDPARGLAAAVCVQRS